MGATNRKSELKDLAAAESGTLQGSRSRLLFVDNLRIGLMILVVWHHVAMAYGAAGLEFYYVELHPDGFSRSLLIFVLGNQAWFMGAFFLIAGYFTPASFDMKGPGRFLWSRLLRLGIPLVAYALLLNPLAMLGNFFVEDYLGPLTWETYEYTDYVRMGPMWFVAMLLIFNFGYAAWRLARKTRSAPSEAKPSLPGFPATAIFVLALAGASYLLRTEIPVGDERFGFPSLAYLPQYLSFFVVGTLAYRRDWFRRIPVSMGWAGFATALSAAIFLFPLAFSGKMFSLELSEALSNAFAEGGHWQAAVYAAWDSAMAVGLCFGLVVLFRQLLDAQGSTRRFLARHSYTVYVIHIPVVVFLAVMLRNVEMEHLLKFGMAGVIAVPLCFGVAAVVRKVPYVSKVL